MFNPDHDGDLVDFTHLTNTPLATEQDAEVPVLLARPVDPGPDELPSRYRHMS